MHSLTYARSSSPSQSSILSGQVGSLSSGRATPMMSTPIKDKDRDSMAGSTEKRVRERVSTPCRVGALERKTSSDSILKRSATTGDAHASFVPPAVTPRKEDWMPDDQFSSCVICQGPFSMVGIMFVCLFVCLYFVETDSLTVKQLHVTL